jgi:hypothetical protein
LYWAIHSFEREIWDKPDDSSDAKGTKLGLDFINSSMFFTKPNPNPVPKPNSFGNFGNENRI